MSNQWTISAQVDLTDLLKKIDKATQLQAFKNGLHLAALEVEKVLKIYPPERHAPQPFKTEKQRRYFFYALRKGLIEVPYIRRVNINSQDMRANWEVKPLDNGFTQVIGNPISYSKYVHGNTEQNHYHKVTGWKTVAQIAKSMEPRIVQIVSAEVAKDL